MKIKLFTILILFAVISNFSATAQSKKGQIVGVVNDSQNGDVLPFSNVSIDGSTIGGTTDDKGFYRISSLNPGSYKLKVSYVGYTPQIISFKISGDEIVTLNIKLKSSSIEMIGVTITALQKGQQKAINTELNATEIKNVLSGVKIRELPDANAAEALSRLPGVAVNRSGGEATSITIRGTSNNTLYVNGMRMDGGLASIASSMMGGAEISKTFLPDQDGDVQGGKVDIKMREADKGFRKELNVRSGYNDFTKSFKMQDASIILSNRFFNNKLGVIVGLSYDRKDRGKDNMSASYDIISKSSAISTNIVPVKLTDVILSNTRNLNNRYGVTLNTDYQLENGKLYLQSFYSNMQSNNQTGSDNYLASTAAINYQSSDYMAKETNFLNGLGGEHTLLGMKIDWGVTSSYYDNSNPDQYNYGASQRNGMSNIITINDSTSIKDYLGRANPDISQTYASTISRTSSDYHKNELSARLNILIPFKFSKEINGYVKFGGKARDILRGQSSSVVLNGLESDAYDKKFQLASKLTAQYPDWQFDKYIFSNQDLSHYGFTNGSTDVSSYSMYGQNLYFTPDFGKVRNVMNFLEPYWGTSLIQQKDDYENNEQIYAGYIMSSINLSKYVTLTSGVRYERDNYSTTGRYLKDSQGVPQVPASQGIFKDTTGASFNEYFLPMVHLKIKPLEWFDIRLSYSETLTRPDNNDMSPKMYEDIYGYCSIGNMKLKPQTNENYDIYLSFYTGKLGLFTAGAFYKKIQGQEFYYYAPVQDPKKYLPLSIKPGNYVNFFINNQWPGHIKGLELSWQTNFSYLPKPFNGFSLDVNATMMASDTKYPFYYSKTIVIKAPPFRTTVGVDSSRVSPVIGMPYLVGNVNLSYEIGGFSARISGYYQGNTYNSIDYIKPSLDTDKSPLFRVDFKANYKFKQINGMSMSFDIANLTNMMDQVVLTNTPYKPISQERYGSSIDLGIRYVF